MWHLALAALTQTVSAQSHGLRGITLGLDGAVHFHTYEQPPSLFAVNIDGSPKWNMTFSDARQIQARQEGPDGTVYVQTDAAAGFKVYAVNGSDGSMIWEHETAFGCEGFPSSCKLFVSDGNVYVGNNGRGAVEAVDAANGSSKWVVAVEWDGESVPFRSIETGPGALVVEGGPPFHGGAFQVLDPENGLTKWTFSSEPPEHTNAATVQATISKDGSIFAKTQNYHSDEVGVLHLNGQDGSVIWNASHHKHFHHRTSQGMYFDPPVSGLNGDVYINHLVDENGNCGLMAFDITGNTTHSLPCSEDLGYGSDFQHATMQKEDGTDVDFFAAVLSDEYVVAGSDHLLWNFSIGTVQSHSHIRGLWLGPDGTVLVSDARTLFAIRSGELAWSMPLVEERITDHPVMAEDGTTYLGLNSRLWAIDANGTLKWKIPEVEHNIVVV